MFAFTVAELLARLSWEKRRDDEKQGCQMVSFQNQKNPIWVNFGGP
jgi:hypothetical protein